MPHCDYITIFFVILMACRYAIKCYLRHQPLLQLFKTLNGPIHIVIIMSYLDMIMLLFTLLCYILTLQCHILTLQSHNSASTGSMSRVYWIGTKKY